jgi:hypothetical protein
MLVGSTLMLTLMPNIDAHVDMTPINVVRNMSTAHPTCYGDVVRTALSFMMYTIFGLELVACMVLGYATRNVVTHCSPPFIVRFFSCGARIRWQIYL